VQALSCTNEMHNLQKFELKQPQHNLNICTITSFLQNSAHFAVNQLSIADNVTESYENYILFKYKTFQFVLSVKDDNYDACKNANIEISGRQNLAKWALTFYGGSTHERLLSESSRPYMLAYYLFLYVLLLCIGQEVITVSISFHLMYRRENIML
jgi:hypothetical protein